MAEAVPNTLEIADRCNVEIELGKLLLPRFPTPDGSEPEEMLRRLANEGLRRRYGDPVPAEALARLEMELGVIEEMAFLPIPDRLGLRPLRQGQRRRRRPRPRVAAGSIVPTASRSPTSIRSATTCSSSASSIPRRSMPDIDIDFSVRGRER